MTQKNIFLFSLLVISSILILMIYQIRQEIDAKQLSIIDVPATQKQSSLVQTTQVLSEKNEMQEVQNKPQNQNEGLLKQRDQVFLDFAHMLQEMSEGRKPNFLYIKTFLAQQQTLLEKGLVSKEEANGHIEFLKKLLPEFDMELTQAHEKINTD